MLAQITQKVTDLVFSAYQYFAHLIEYSGFNNSLTCLIVLTNNSQLSSINI